MTTLTPEILNAVLAKQGMPNTTENLNRIAEFAATNPGMLEKYLGVGTDNAMAGVANSIANVDGAAPVGPTNGYKATLDPTTGMTNMGPNLVNAPPPVARGNGGARPAVNGPGASRQLNYGPGPDAPSNLGAGQHGPTPSQPMLIHGAPSQAPSANLNAPVPGAPQYAPGGAGGGGQVGEQSSMSPAILAAIAATVAGGAYGVKKMFGGGAAPTPADASGNANARGKGAGAGAMPSPEALAAEGQPKPKKPTFQGPNDDPDKIAKMRSEVDTENLQNEMKRKQNAARNAARAAGKGR